MKRFAIQRNDGFTLIEVILIIVVASIMAVMMFTYSNTSFTKGSWSLTQAKKTYAQQKVMENILADYNLSYKSNIVGLQTKIGNTASQQDPPAGYGPYTLVDNYFIAFNNGAETAANSTDKNILKVTIQNDHGETLSMLFTNIAQ
ncbi:MAG: hypothetical protein A4E71_03151 [Smithella sp. PtaU1.Bin162]|nr:MAG: hypothetical protein A4E71_03151 [Smithella sp. PtaU1.Bin162]